MMVFKTPLFIINLYREVTGNKWTPYDDRVGQKFADLDSRLVEVTIRRVYLRSQRRQPKKLRSFNYFNDALEDALLSNHHLSGEGLDVMLQQTRKGFEHWRQTGEVPDMYD